MKSAMSSVIFIVNVSVAFYPDFSFPVRARLQKAILLMLGIRYL